MITRDLWRFMLFLTIISTALSSCGDDNENGISTEAQTTQGKSFSADYHISQSEADQALAYVDNAMLTAGQGGRVRGIEETYCAAYSHDKDNNTIVLDFGTDGCTGTDGKTRSGKITVIYAGVLDPLGSNQRIVSFTDYTVDGNVLNGTITATRWEIAQGSSSLKSTATAANMSLKFAADGTTFSWNGSWERVLSLDIEDFANSTYSFTGGATGTTRGGDNFVSTITSAITYQLSCLQAGIPYATQGVRNVALTTTIPLVIEVDYGAGTCDKDITLSINGNTVAYTLP